jgi:hypothetical protein
MSRFPRRQQGFQKSHFLTQGYLKFTSPLKSLDVVLHIAKVFFVCYNYKKKPNTKAKYVLILITPGLGAVEIKLPK